MGESGNQGPIGLTGDMGEKGDIGEKGERGDRGIQVREGGGGICRQRVIARLLSYCRDR